MNPKSINQIVSPCTGKITYNPETTNKLPDPTYINNFFIATTPNMPIRCVDGRPATSETANHGNKT